MPMARGVDGRGHLSAPAAERPGELREMLSHSTPAD